MAKEFRLPDIGEGLTEAEIVRWLVAEGEHVAADQPLVEVETDKAVVEIPSPYEGTVLRHGAAEGETIEVGSILVVVGTEEASTRDEASTPAEAPVVVPRPREVASAMPIVGSLSEDAEDLSPGLGGPLTAEGDQVKALPLVRKLAREMGVDLQAVAGSGPDGRITRDDVVAASAGTVSPPISEGTLGVPVESAAPAPTSGGVEEMQSASEGAAIAEDERRPMSRLRRTIAANMSKSWAEIPHVTTFDDVDATRLLEVREALGARYEMKVPLEALVIKAVVPALMAFPEFNATLEGDDLILHSSHDIGIAADTPDGLLVAVVRDASTRGVLELATEVRRLGEGAKGRQLGVEELTGQTFTVSNIGAVGGGHGTPIVPYGTTAILSVGRARQKPIVESGDLVIAPMLPLSLSYDHRVIDGAQGRRFMAQVMENLEEPALFLAT